MIITDEAALRIKCVDALPDEVGPLIEQLERELKHSATLGLPGIGLAAPQIGINKNVAIVRVSNEYSVNLVNCSIEEGLDKALFDREGCLSFPGRFEKTMRYQEVFISKNAVEPFSFICSGLMAVVAQHELDHLVGKLLPDVALVQAKTGKKKQRPNDRCACNSGKKYKKCCYLKK